MTDLLEYHNMLVQLRFPTIPHTLRTRWLWELNLREDVSARQMLNEAHLTGLVLCRTAALERGTIEGDPRDTLGNSAVIHTRYADMSMRGLHDSVEHCQMHMHDLIDTDEGGKYEEHLDRLFARLGQLLLPLDIPKSMFDDTDSLDVGIDGTTTKVMTKVTIRWFMNVFVILFRHIELHRIAKTPVPVGPRVQLESFHIEASRDDFYNHAQYFDLPPAAALCYASDFGDLLNNVSQITFYCFPDYTRRELLEEEQVSTGDHPIYTLAAALAMFPGITVVHEDDSFSAPPGILGSAAHQKAGWRVVLGPGTIMLLSPTGELLKHKNVLELLRAVPIQ